MHNQIVRAIVFCKSTDAQCGSRDGSYSLTYGRDGITITGDAAPTI